MEFNDLIDQYANERLTKSPDDIMAEVIQDIFNTTDDKWSKYQILALCLIDVTDTDGEFGRKLEDIQNEEDHDPFGGDFGTSHELEELALELSEIPAHDALELGLKIGEYL